MKNLLIPYVLSICLLNCNIKENHKANKLVGTWELVHAETCENDSIKTKDLKNTRFIKIINNTHFSFFNQEKNSHKNFYGGAGRYELKGNNYIETLQFTSIEAFRNHRFLFNITFKGDTLIQSGLEVVKAAGIKRTIIEKYIRIQ